MWPLKFAFGGVVPEPGPDVSAIQFESGGDGSPVPPAWPRGRGAGAVLPAPRGCGAARSSGAPVLRAAARGSPPLRVWKVIGTRCALASPCFGSCKVCVCKMIVSVTAVILDRGHRNLTSVCRARSLAGNVFVTVARRPLEFWNLVMGMKCVLL